MTLPRVLKPGTTYLVTRRCLERRFRLRPEQAVNDLLDYLVGYAALQSGVEVVAMVVLGGGDGLAVRELLRYPEIEHIDLIDLDAAVTDLFQKNPLGVGLNGGSLNDPRVKVRNEDGYRFLDETAELAYDLAVVDFPDPSNYAVGKLYTDAFYQLLRSRLGVRGLAVVQATSPAYAKKTYWSIVATIEAGGFKAVPFHAYVPSFGDWGFVLAGGAGLEAPRTLVLDTASLRYLDERVLPELFTFSKDTARVEGTVNRLNDQKLVSTYTAEWAEWTK